MSFKVKKELLCHILFAICVAIPYINYYEATFAVWGLAILLTLRKSYSLSFLQYIGLFVCILLIAVVGGLLHAHYQSYMMIKDITYLLKPILGLLVGYQLCRVYVRNPMRVIVNTALIIAILHILVLAHAFLVYHVRNINDLRKYGGYFSDFEIYALVILWFHHKFDLALTRRQWWIFITVIGVSSFLYLARTNFLQFVILWMALKGYFAVNRRSIIVFGSLVSFALVGYTIIYNSNPRRGAKGLEALMYKIKIAPMEPFKTKVNRDDWVDFNDNYRSYENIITIRQVSSDGTAAVLFGRGIGSTIDLKVEVWLQTSMMRYIPFLHNGFMTVFLKSGLVGVAIYLMTIIFFFQQRKSDVPLSRQIRLLFIGTGFFLFISNWVFLGFYNLFDTKTILMGFLLAYRERLHKNNHS